MTAPALSVVIAAYNAADTLGQQLEALSGQRARIDFEVVVADNGSTDDTARLLEAWTSTRFVLRVVDASERRGGAHAKNVGAQESASENLAFCDADDIVAETWVQASYSALLTAPIVSIPREYVRLNPWFRGAPVARGRTCFNVPVISGGAFGCRRDLYLELGGFDAAFSGSVDDEFSLRFHQRYRVAPAEADTVVHVRLRDSAWERVRRKYLLSQSTPALAKRFSDWAPTQGLRFGLRRWGSITKRALRWPLMSVHEREDFYHLVASAAGHAVGSLRHRHVFL